MWYEILTSQNISEEEGKKGIGINRSRENNDNQHKRKIRGYKNN